MEGLCFHYLCSESHTQTGSERVAVPTQIAAVVAPASWRTRRGQCPGPGERSWQFGLAAAADGEMEQNFVMDRLFSVRERGATEHASYAVGIST